MVTPLDDHPKLLQAALVEVVEHTYQPFPGATLKRIPSTNELKTIGLTPQLCRPFNTPDHFPLDLNQVLVMRVFQAATEHAFIEIASENNFTNPRQLGELKILRKHVQRQDVTLLVRTRLLLKQRIRSCTYKIQWPESKKARFCFFKTRTPTSCPGSTLYVQVFAALALSTPQQRFVTWSHTFSSRGQG